MSWRKAITFQYIIHNENFKMNSKWVNDANTQK